MQKIACLMSKIFLVLGVLFFTNLLRAFPVECPPVSSLYHGGPGTGWEVSQMFVNKGWAVSQNPDAMNTNLENTSYENGLVATISNLNASKIYYFSCVYQIGYPDKHVSVVLINRWPQSDPGPNTTFHRTDEGIFLCNTTLSHPDNCKSSTIAAANEGTGWVGDVIKTALS